MRWLFLIYRDQRPVLIPWIKLIADRVYEGKKEYVSFDATCSLCHTVHPQSRNKTAYEALDLSQSGVIKTGFIVGPTFDDAFTHMVKGLDVSEEYRSASLIFSLLLVTRIRKSSRDVRNFCGTDETISTLSGVVCAISIPFALMVGGWWWVTMICTGTFAWWWAAPQREIERLRQKSDEEFEQRLWFPPTEVTT